MTGAVPVRKVQRSGDRTEGFQAGSRPPPARKGPPVVDGPSSHPPTGLTLARRATDPGDTLPQHLLERGTAIET